MSKIVAGLKASYLNTVSLLSKAVKRHEEPQLVGYFMSFPHNEAGVIDALATGFGKENIVIFHTRKCLNEANRFKREGYRIHSVSSGPNLLPTIQHLVNCRWLICDNYFHLLGAVKLNDKCQVIQIWHANGAIKKFGWEDPATALRSRGDKKRFKKIYDRFDFYLVASEEMGNVFQKSYGAEKHQLLPFGFHRSDMFFNTVAVKNSQNIEAIDDKSVLYMPTYREDDQVIEEALIALDREAGKKDMNIFYKLHPVTMNRLNNQLQFKHLIPVDLEKESYADLYRRVKYLITDYSSVPFDFSLANPSGRIQFYWPDFQEYEKATGIQESIKEIYLPTAIKTLDGLISSLDNDSSINLLELNEKWNTYNDGVTIERLVDFMKSKK